MRAFLLTLSFLLPLSAGGQQPSGQPTTQPLSAPAAGSNWQHVQALPADTSIRVSTTERTLVCNLISVDTDSLTCTHRKNATFQRAEIKSIKLSKRSRSTGSGIAIGGATGVAAVEAAWNNHWSWNGVNRKSVAAFVGVPFAAIGGLVGYSTDFTGSTIYKAP